MVSDSVLPMASELNDPDTPNADVSDATLHAAGAGDGEPVDHAVRVRGSDATGTAAEM